MFEFDPNKSAANLEKHGIDFIAAQELWQDDYRLAVPAKTEGEVRYALIAKLDGKVWTAIYTPRGGNIRIISVRRARDNEEKLYENFRI
ncbi:BrnT family toxin [Bergeriella denitrificans]|uniref:Protein of uncharacterized function (DUF497) n=1 Tax=Bergeriella denitrificans TaxID=494 RepID=A0A378UGH8_BERDE|nr:BrnT family toxin [Bergeriella denitrificans]STZ76484.1 Protein of uncharacterised function (DUF497) [Bergeriella denitrificans]